MNTFICTKFPIHWVYTGTLNTYYQDGPLWTKVTENICKIRKHAAVRKQSMRRNWERYIASSVPTMKEEGIPLNGMLEGTIDDFLRRFGYSVSDFLVMRTESLNVCGRCERVKL